MKPQYEYNISIDENTIKGFYDLDDAVNYFIKTKRPKHSTVYLDAVFGGSLGNKKSATLMVMDDDGVRMGYWVKQQLGA